MVNIDTLEVYGHLVAWDSFGQGFVIPLPLTFDEIRCHLDASSVELASAIDVFCAQPEFGQTILPVEVSRSESSPKKTDWQFDTAHLDSGYHTMRPSFQPSPSDGEDSEDGDSAYDIPSITQDTNADSLFPPPIIRPQLSHLESEPVHMDYEVNSIDLDSGYQTMPDSRFPSC